MLAITTADLSTLEKDVAMNGVQITYRKDGVLKKEEIGRDHFDHAPRTEIVMRAFLEVSLCDCESCRDFSGEEPTMISIPVEDIVDVAVEEWDASSPEDTYPFSPVARWLRNRWGMLVRFALD